MKNNAGSYPNSTNIKTITPREIVAEPNLYNTEYQKILSADIMFPIVMINNNTIFDGHHRLVKAILFNVPTINAYLIKSMRALDLYFGHIST
jgi:disulfide oxidoreductase YuzD